MTTFKYATLNNNNVTINQGKWSTEAVLTNSDGEMIMNNMNIIDWKVSRGSLLLTEGGSGQVYSIALDLTARPIITLDK